MKIFLFITTLTVWLISCTPPVEKPITHTYVLNITGKNVEPIDSVDVYLEVGESGEKVQNYSFVKKLPIYRVTTYSFFPENDELKGSYFTTLNFTINIDKRFHLKSEMMCDWLGHTDTANIVLNRYTYTIQAMNTGGNAIDSAQVKFQSFSNSSLVNDGLGYTNKNGEFKTYVYASDFSDLDHAEINFRISKVGYYSGFGEITLPDTTTTLVLIQPSDYLSKHFPSSSKYVYLRKNIIGFIDLIRTESKLNNSNLERYSIDISPFKNNDYLTFKFNNTLTYNSIRLDKYDIGKRVFDEIIRKILDPLNSLVGNSNAFYGYDLVVFGHTRNFTEDFTIDENIKYRFLISKSVAKSYKNNDISGQQLLDSSVILMNGERIELNLQ